ncbi:hypothetical protein Syn7502_02546 [Synechococcus sp. PCC 7502]|uniref:hypothetical protein n=1 Tax=Synechococcus sp. PCC 7502 TaxID=1173263 RepID=UPI00029FA1E5|nr:hypothetical protein [Synechococcus sp. PCC 7502]AFY74517.1 hypothetical protein Syn7502_02546 [Synechococcus sp. PCC 7502]
MKFIYSPLPEFSDRPTVNELVEKLLEPEFSEVTEELLVLPLAVGENFPDWKYAQDICLRLAEHNNNQIRANACLGLAYIARTKGKLEKHLVKPILLRELRSQTEWRWRVEDAIQDINIYLQWHLAFKHLETS